MTQMTFLQHVNQNKPAACRSRMFCRSAITLYTCSKVGNAGVGLCVDRTVHWICCPYMVMFPTWRHASSMHSIAVYKTWLLSYEPVLWNQVDVTKTWRVTHLVTSMQDCIAHWSRRHSRQISSGTFPVTFSADQLWLGQNSETKCCWKFTPIKLNNSKNPHPLTFEVFSNLKCFAVLSVISLKRGKRLMRQIRRCGGFVSICLLEKKHSLKNNELL